VIFIALAYIIVAAFLLYSGSFINAAFVMWCKIVVNIPGLKDI